MINYDLPLALSSFFFFFFLFPRSFLDKKFFNDFLVAINRFRVNQSLSETFDYLTFSLCLNRCIGEISYRDNHRTDNVKRERYLLRN